MPLKTESISFPYPVADTESGPTIYWQPYSLTVTFTDYAGNDCQLLFEDVVHFQLISEDEAVGQGYQYDGVVKVIDSPVIARLVEIGEIPTANQERYCHIVIGFNEIGSYLIVVYSEMNAY